MAALMRHIAFQGFIEGAGSDLTIRAFDKTYYLHRLILTQSPFFQSMIFGPWKECGLSEVELVFDDTNINMESFELVLGRMYGICTIEAEVDDDDEVDEVDENENEINGEEQDRVQRPFHSQHDQDQRQEQHEHQQEYTVVFAGNHPLYASRLTPDNALSVLASATYLGIDSLCVQVTAYILRTLSAKTVSANVHFCERHSYHPWSSRISDACHTFLCRNGYDDPKIQHYNVFENLPSSWLPRILGPDAFWVPSEWDRYLFCRRIVARRRQKACQLGSHRTLGLDACHGKNSEEDQDEQEAAYDILFRTGIIYMHMSLERLQLIQNDKDPNTHQPFTPPHTVHEAFWHQTELRALIESSTVEMVSSSAFGFGKSQGGGHHAAVLGTTTLECVENPSMAEAIPPFVCADGRYLIPSHDGTTVTRSPASTRGLQAPSRDSNDTPKQQQQQQQQHSAPLYSLYAPFRFSVQFEDVSKLDFDIPIASDCVYYAGSHWNVYLKKLPHGEKGTKLAIYLHRVSVAAPTSSSTPLIRRTNIRPVFGAPSPTHELSSCSSPSTLSSLSSSHSSTSSLSTTSSHGKDTDPLNKNTYAGKGKERPAQGTNAPKQDDTLPYIELDDLRVNDTVPLNESFSCFPDKRESTMTWFRIYAASLGPDHRITHFQAAPDTFDCKQSWI
ncbi:hypothetical protein BGZ94_010249 [Podila epigama]|nr:hypothetical protein BGZ94_010249 [Podila epigama]